VFGRGSGVSSAGGRAAALHRTQLAGAWHPHLLIPIIAVARQSTTDSRSASIGHATESRQNFNYDDRDRLTQAWTTGNAANSYNESYAYNNIGNLTSKAGTTYTYPAAGSARPHTPTTVGGTSYLYDANGNLTGGSGRTYTWNAENLPTTISYTSGSENYSYDADGERVKVVNGSTTTVYLEGVWEEVVGGTTKVYYPFNGQMVAVRDTSANTVTYLHADHLGSISVATNISGVPLNSQEFDPWGKVRLGAVSQTSRNYTGQILDGSKLLYYHARYYDPGLGRFVSADSLISDPQNPQVFNRYSYAKNNPLHYTDPTGHCHYDKMVILINGIAR
jgi:RHS repeat-associated protein